MSLFGSYLKFAAPVATKSLQDKAKRNTPNSTEVGPIGENILTFDGEGCILKSGIKAFIPGNTIWDYVPERYHTQIGFVIEVLPEIKQQPLVVDFEVLFGGRYHHRRARVYYLFDYQYLIKVEDLPVQTNLIDYTAFPSSSENLFTVAINGLILDCKYPERTINGEPVGLNIFDILLPQYVEVVREAMRWVLHKRIELPIEYEFTIDGQSRYKKGTIKPNGGTVIFHVRRIASPHQKMSY